MNRIYEAVPSLMMARRNIMRNSLRSGLACFGIVIGVVAIASLGVLGFTLTEGLMEDMDDLANEVEVTPATASGGMVPGGGVGSQTLSDRDVQNVRQAAVGAEVMPIKEEAVEVEWGEWSTSLTALSVDDPSTLFEADEGRLPAQLSSGVLVGSSMADNLDVSPGSAITVDNSSYRVVAILEQESFTSTVNPNFNVVVPEAELRGVEYSRVVVEEDSAEAANTTAQRIESSLNHREDVVDVEESADLVETLESQQNMLSMFLIGVGSISLFVAGVSILNVMLMSTVERREEIGVLRAVGVQRTSVLKVLLAEAALLGFVGGAIGVVLSVAIGAVINHFMLDDALMVFRPGNLRYFAQALAFAVGISLVSGAYPAWKAANERPVEALRG